MLRVWSAAPLSRSGKVRISAFFEPCFRSTIWHHGHTECFGRFHRSTILHDIARLDPDGLKAGSGQLEVKAFVFPPRALLLAGAQIPIIVFVKMEA